MDRKDCEDSDSDECIPLQKRRSSILKPRKSIAPDLDDTEVASEVAPVRRVSFAASNYVKPFVTDAEKNTIWDSTYEEEANHTDSTKSDCTNPTMPSKLLNTGTETVYGQQSMEMSTDTSQGQLEISFQQRAINHTATDRYGTQPPSFGGNIVGNINQPTQIVGNLQQSNSRRENIVEVPKKLPNVTQRDIQSDLSFTCCYQEVVIPPRQPVIHPQQGNICEENIIVGAPKKLSSIMRVAQQDLQISRRTRQFPENIVNNYQHSNLFGQSTVVAPMKLSSISSVAQQDAENAMPRTCRFPQNDIQTTLPVNQQSLLFRENSVPQKRSPMINVTQQDVQCDMSFICRFPDNIIRHTQLVNDNHTVVGGSKKGSSVMNVTQRDMQTDMSFTNRFDEDLLRQAQIEAQQQQQDLQGDISITHRILEQTRTVTYRFPENTKQSTSNEASVLPVKAKIAMACDPFISTSDAHIVKGKENVHPMLSNKGDLPIPILDDKENVHGHFDKKCDGFETKSYQQNDPSTHLEEAPAKVVQSLSGVSQDNLQSPNEEIVSIVKESTKEMDVYCTDFSEVLLPESINASNRENSMQNDIFSKSAKQGACLMEEEECDLVNSCEFDLSLKSFPGKSGNNLYPTPSNLTKFDVFQSGNSSVLDDTKHFLNYERGASLNEETHNPQKDSFTSILELSRHFEDDAISENIRSNCVKIKLPQIDWAKYKQPVNQDEFCGKAMMFLKNYSVPELKSFDMRKAREEMTKNLPQNHIRRSMETTLFARRDSLGVDLLSTVEDTVVKLCSKKLSKHLKLFKHKDDEFAFKLLYDSLYLHVKTNSDSGQVLDMNFFSVLHAEAHRICHFIEKTVKKRLSKNNLSSFLGEDFDVLTLLDYVYMALEEATSFQKDFLVLSYRKEFHSLDLNEDLSIRYTLFNLNNPPLGWKVRIDMPSISKIQHDNITIEPITRSNNFPNEDCIKNLLKNVEEGPKCLESFLRNLNEYFNSQINSPQSRGDMLVRQSSRP